MNDRTPTKPGRVLITPESGVPYYAVLTMADEPTQEGTPPTKANLLTDAVAALWGGDSSSNVTDILKYAASRYGTCATAAATAAKVVTLSDFVLSIGAVIGVNFSYKNAASSPTLNVNGVGAKAIYFNGSVVSTSQIPKMAYFQYDGTYWQLINGPTVQLATGNYTGTGTYGSGSPNSLSFPFAPAVVFIVSNTSTMFNYVGNPLILVKGRAAKFYITPGITQTDITPSFSGNSVSWYSTSGPYSQQNESGQQYTYVAIG